MKKNKDGTLYLSQHEFRQAVNKFYPGMSEEVIKYNYDRYTYYLKVQPIRKQKLRKKIGSEARWHKLDLTPLLAYRDSSAKIQLTKDKVWGL
jgi:hypothetical protein